MKKLLCFLLSLGFLFGAFAGCTPGENSTDSSSGTDSEQSSADYTIDENGNYVYELFLDPDFNSGFSVSAANNSDGDNYSYPLDYKMLVPGGTGICSWQCAQWGCKYGFGDSYGAAELTGHDPYEVKCIDGEYNFEAYDGQGRISHALRVNPSKSKITMDLNASVEYTVNGEIVPRKDNEYWPHILLSQGFAKTPAVRDLENFMLSCDVSINYCKNMHPEGTYNSGAHAAQFLMYLVVKSNNDTEYMWFGIPFFDDRYPKFPEHDQIDGVENKFLYQVPGTAFAPNGVKADGTVMHVNIDLKDYFERALSIAKSKYERFLNSSVEDLYVSGMNVGWELPGVFDVSATISNYSLKAITKKKL